MKNTRKKLNLKKKSKKIIHKMNQTVVKKEIMTEKDLRTILAGYVRSNNFDSIPEWLEIYKNDFPGPLNQDTMNSLLSHIQNINFKNNDEMETYLTLVLEDIPVKDYNETTYTAFIKVYSDKRFFNQEKIKEYLTFMMMNNIKVKRRTLGPIIDLCQKISDLHLCLSIFGLAKSRNLQLLDEDYMNILLTIHKNKSEDYFNKMIIIDDMLKSLYILDNKCEEVLDEVFKTNLDLSVLPSGLIENDIPIKKVPSFKFTQKDITLFSEKIEHHVSNIHPKKKTLLITFKKFLKKQKYDTVIDGANVGFFKQGTNSGKVLNFSQIKLFVDKAVSMGRKVLLILHERHIRNIKKSNSLILDEIKSKVNYFFSPQGMDDDMYWLYSTITNPIANIITNDEMRNHIVNISVGNMFTEWKKYKVIKYNIVNKEVLFKIPPTYMTRPVVNGKNIIIPFKNTSERINWKYYTY
tara:strand:- start:100 stop:1491 length:1392 start_codon:yes stop_codon:yes gene_type:complete